MYKLY